VKNVIFVKTRHTTIHFATSENAYDQNSETIYQTVKLHVILTERRHGINQDLSLFIPSATQHVMVKWAILLLYTQKVWASVLGPERGYSFIFLLTYFVIFVSISS
jgi:hypothetical protein